jgi:drug/metabolite transporter (DMT)-like permease
LTAALGYAAANVALRAATETDAILVSAAKSWPTVAACAPLLIWMLLKKQKVATSWSTFPTLLLGVTIGQLFGNVLFQVSLGIIGLALSVPLNLSAMIIGGAVMGRVLLGDPVSRRTIVAIVILIVATVVLSMGGSTILPERPVTPMMFALGVAAALVSGAAYSFFGTAMRKGLREGLTVPLAMGASGMVGVLLLTPLAVGVMGVEKIAATSTVQWWAIVLAGTFNMAAFFMLSFSLRAIPVVAVNLLNATQAALAALAGVWWFNEELTTSMVLGSAITIAGLVVLGTGPTSVRRRSFPPTPHQQTS